MLGGDKMENDFEPDDLDIRKPISARCNRKDLRFLTYGKVYTLYYDLTLNNEAMYVLETDVGDFVRLSGKDFAFEKCE